jgi:hypothetical protein
LNQTFPYLSTFELKATTERPNCPRWLNAGQRTTEQLIEVVPFLEQLLNRLTLLADHSRPRRGRLHLSMRRFDGRLSKKKSAAHGVTVGAHPAHNSFLLCNVQIGALPDMKSAV